MNMDFLVLSGLLFLTLHHDCVKGLVVRTDNGPIVESITAGTIRGLRSQDDNYNMFLGIPYATVNESNPFGPSVPHSPFEGIFDAHDDTAICPQIEEFNLTFAGSLDCLHLNIYVPDSASPQNRLPVMVYIYGGSFYIGFTGRFLYGPEYLIRNDVILVTLNYRLGAFGFMCSDIPEVPGNQGLKDQVLALRWIKNNIEAFGGDPNKVTVFGNSAGGMSIGLHLISETEQLFESGIQQSGSAFMSTISEPNPNALIQLAFEMGFSTNDIYEALNYLSQQEAQAVVEATMSFGIVFGPCIEKEYPSADRFLSQRAINSNHSKALNIKMMIGFNSEEMLPFFQYTNNDNILLAWREAFSQNLLGNFEFSESQLERNEGIVRRFYIGDEEISNEIRRQVMHFSSDMTFVYPAIRSIKYILNGGAEKVYQYVFSYDGQRNFLKVKDGISEAGAAHADEIGYLFKMEFIPETPNAEDQLVIDRMTAMWTNFAKYGDPTPSTSSLLPIKWEAITKNSPYNYININYELSAGRRYETKRMSFWDLFYNSFQQYEVGYKKEENEEDGSEEEPDTTPDPNTTPDPDPTPDPDTTPDPVTTPDPGSANALCSFSTLTLLVTTAVSLYIY